MTAVQTAALAINVPESKEPGLWLEIHTPSPKSPIPRASESLARGSNRTIHDFDSFFVEHTVAIRGGGCRVRLDYMIGFQAGQTLLSRSLSLVGIIDVTLKIAEVLHVSESRVLPVDSENPPDRRKRRMFRDETNSRAAFGQTPEPMIPIIPVR